MIASIESMWLLVLIFVVGLAFVVYGADFLVDGSSALARKAGISEFVIGLTIVGFGTSCPELVVSVNGALAGNSAVALGNVLGSNIFNIMLILGLTALISPVAVSAENRKRDIPLVIGATVLLVAAGMAHTLFGIGSADQIGRIGGIAFLVIFALYIWSCFKFDSKDAGSDTEEKQFGLWQAIGLIILGLAGLIAGGKMFVDSAVEIAHRVGVSDKVVAITILAGGTSLPELATCVIAALKHKGTLALGNVLGSNVFNILLILGTAATISPVSFAAMNWLDLGALLASALLLLGTTFTGRKDRIDKWEGALFVVFQIAYFVYLFIHL